LSRQQLEHIAAQFDDDEAQELAAEIQLMISAAKGLAQLAQSPLDPRLRKTWAEDTIGVTVLQELSTKDIEGLLGAVEKSIPGLSTVIPVMGWMHFKFCVSKPKERKRLQKFATDTRRSQDGLTPTFQIDPIHREVTLSAEALGAITKLEWMDLRPRWVQLVGVIAVLCHLFRKDQSETKATPGFLINDDTGIGKTGQAAILVAAISHAIDLEKNSLALPPYGMNFFIWLYITNWFNSYPH
jgi:hypothetical protein